VHTWSERSEKAHHRLPRVHQVSRKHERHEAQKDTAGERDDERLAELDKLKSVEPHVIDQVLCALIYQLGNTEVFLRTRNARSNPPAIAGFLDDHHARTKIHRKVLAALLDHKRRRSFSLGLNRTWYSLVGFDPTLQLLALR